MPTRAARPGSAVISPLVLVELIAAGHNDALMAGLMVAGVALARQRHPLVGVALCALAATIKVPAGLGVLFILVSWARDLSTMREKVRFVVAALLIAFGVGAAVSAMTGLGVGWVSTTLLSTPGKVHLAITPVTAFGWSLAKLLHAAGAMVSMSGFESGFEDAALLATAVLGVVLLWRARSDTFVLYLGVVLLAAALGGPAAWPWYFCWGLVLVSAWPTVQQSRLLPIALAISVLAVKPDGILILPLQAAPACAVFYLALVVLVTYRWRGRRRVWPDPVRQGTNATATPERHPRELSRGLLLDLAALTGPAVLAAGLSFYEIGARSIWLDESASISIASQHGAALGTAMAHDGGNMLAYYALVHVMIEVFGNGIVALRAPSAIAAACTVGLVSLLAKRLFNRAVAFASGMLSAVSLPLVFWGQDVRAYSLMVALVAASFLAFVALVDREPESRPSTLALCAYVLATTLAMYMSFVAVLVVPAQLLALVCHRRRLRPVALGLVVSAFCCIPLAVLAHNRGSGQLFWVPRPNFSTVNAAVGELVSSSLQPQFALTATSYAVLGLSLVLLVGAAVTAARTISR